MVKVKELLFRRFSLLGGLLALASILVLSYFYYRLQADTPFVYEKIIANISEYRVLDSKFTATKDHLIFQQSLVASIEEQFLNLSNRDIKVPNSDALYEIKTSIVLRIRWLESCAAGGSCNIEEWNNAQVRAWIAGETLQTSFYGLLQEHEKTWSKNLRIFYILSVLLLLTTLFFAARRG